MDFQRVVRLHAHGLSVEEIRVSTRLSERLIQEHLALSEEAGLDNDQLEQLLKQPGRATKEPVEAKRGDWLR